MVDLEKKQFFCELTYLLGWSINDENDLRMNTCVGGLFAESELEEMKCKKNALDVLYKFFERENPFFIAIRDDELYQFATEKELKEYDYLTRLEDSD